MKSDHLQPITRGAHAGYVIEVASRVTGRSQLSMLLSVASRTQAGARPGQKHRALWFNATVEAVARIGEPERNNNIARSRSHFVEKCSSRCKQNPLQREGIIQVGRGTMRCSTRINHDTVILRNKKTKHNFARSQTSANQCVLAETRNERVIGLLVDFRHGSIDGSRRNIASPRTTSFLSMRC